jgi:hypothetical protein
MSIAFWIVRQYSLEGTRRFGERYFITSTAFRLLLLVSLLAYSLTMKLEPKRR